MKLHTILIVCIVVALICGVIILYLFNPEQSSFYPPCIFKRITGFDCAGCGSTRALHALLHGKIDKAANYNLLFVLLIPVIFIGLLDQLTFKTITIWNKINKPVIFIVIVCLFWIVRNIDYYPFTYLHSSK